jgi:hypothetical protein
VADLADLAQLEQLEAEAIETKEKVAEMTADRDTLNARIASAKARAKELGEATAATTTAAATTVADEEGGTAGVVADNVEEEEGGESIAACTSPSTDAAHSATYDCHICGWVDLPLKNAPKHIHDCYRKLEVTFSLTGGKPRATPANCPMQAFCNHTNGKRKQFCQRLQAGCPEHGPFKKLHSAESSSVPTVKPLCGWVADLKVDPSKWKPCSLPLLQCNIHLKWELLAHARLASQLVSACLYQDYVDEQVKECNARLTRRRVLLSKMRCETVAHSTEDAAAIGSRASKLADIERARLDAIKREVVTGVKEIAVEMFTGGSIGLPKRNWR